MLTGWTVVGNTVSCVNNSAFGGLGVVPSQGQQRLDPTGNVVAAACARS